MGKKIRFVQLEPAAVLLDAQLRDMSAREFGCYWKLILHLYHNGGKLALNLKTMSKLCNCRPRNFEKVWEKISHKFQCKNGYITHKRVSKELNKAKRFLQHQQRAGLRGAEKRWQPHSDPNGNPNGIAIANKSKVNKSKEKEKGEARRGVARRSPESKEKQPSPPSSSYKSFYELDCERADKAYQEARRKFLNEQK